MGEKTVARNPKQDANLKPIKKGDLSKEELKKRQSNGGKKSGEVRRQKRDAREAARYILGLAAKGQILENTMTLGADKKDGITNLEAMQARLFSMAMGGNLEAYLTLMKMAGYEPKENREERESLSADSRRERELAAKLEALGAAPDTATMSVGIGNEDGANDVVIYIPKMMSEEECMVEEPEEDTEGESAEAAE